MGNNKLTTSLGESDEHFRAMFYQANVGIIHLSLDGRFLRVNSGFCKISGYAQPEILILTVRDITHPDDYVVEEAEIKLLLAGEIEGFSLEKRLIRPDGSLLWITMTGALARRSSGEPLYILSIVEDIDKRKQSEIALYQSNHELRSAHEALEQRVAERTTELKESNEALEKSNTALKKEIAGRLLIEKARQQLMERIVTIQEEERHRISRELHDHMGQSLTALFIGLQALPDWPEPGPRVPSYPQQIEKLSSLTAGLIHDMHRLAWEMRPAALDNVGLEAALQQYVQDWNEHYQTEAHFVQNNHAKAGPVPESISVALYRITQEALTNVQKHAKAQNVSVILEQKPQMIAVIIEDNGKGFDCDEQKNSSVRPLSGQLGLLGMRERMELVGGTLTIESAPQQGTTVYARVPLKTQT